MSADAGSEERGDAEEAPGEHGSGGVDDGGRLRPYEAEGGSADVFEVFVQRERGEPHEHAGTVNAPDADMALVLAKRNVDLRTEPVDVWVAPRRAMRRAGPDDPALAPTTDRSYRTVRWFVDNRIDVEGE